MINSRIGIVGCGNIAKVHSANLRKLGYSLAFFSKNLESAAKLHKASLGDIIFDNFDSMLADSKIKGVVICSPPAFHTEQTIAALSAGKRVLTEKPLCLDPNESALLEKAFYDSGRSLMVAENYYYKPSLKKLKSLIQAGRIGNVKGISIKKVLSEESKGWKASCGSLIEGGIHFVALLTELAQSNPIQANRVNAIFPNKSPNKPEQHSVLDVVFSNGVKGQLEFSTITPSLTKGVFQHSFVFGENGVLGFESNGLYGWLKTPEGRSPLVFSFKDFLGYQAMMDDFVKWVDNPSHEPYALFPRVKSDLNLVWQAYAQLP